MFAFASFWKCNRRNKSLDWKSSEFSFIINLKLDKSWVVILDLTPLFSQNWKSWLIKYLERELVKSRSCLIFWSPSCNKLFSKNYFWKAVSRFFFFLYQILRIHTILWYLSVWECLFPVRLLRFGGAIVERPERNIKTLELRLEEGVSGQHFRLCLTRDPSCQAEFSPLIQVPLSEKNNLQKTSSPIILRKVLTKPEAMWNWS